MMWSNSLRETFQIIQVGMEIIVLKVNQTDFQQKLYNDINQ